MTTAYATAQEGAILEEMVMQGDDVPECELHPHCCHHHPHFEVFFWGDVDEDSPARELDHDASWAGEREDTFYDNLTH